MASFLWMRRCASRFVLACTLAIGMIAVCAAQSRSQPGDHGFAPLTRWAEAVRTGDPASIQAFYSTRPGATFLVSTGFFGDAAREAGFWATWKKAGLTSFRVDVIHGQAISPSLHEIFFQGELAVQTASGPHTFYTFVQQIWQHQGAAWRIINGSRTDLARLKQPDSMTGVIYPDAARAGEDVAAALRRAKAEHKRVLLDFGGNWCYDCHVLDLAFHHSSLTPLLEANYVVVEINVGEFDQNLDLARRYRVPLKKGVPALAVLDSDGQLLTSQQHGEFEAARHLAPEVLVQFLNQWKP